LQTFTNSKIVPKAASDIYIFRIAQSGYWVRKSLKKSLLDNKIFFDEFNSLLFMLSKFEVEKLINPLT